MANKKRYTHLEALTILSEIHDCDSDSGMEFAFAVKENEDTEVHSALSTDGWYIKIRRVTALPTKSVW